jgi:hypothetical protein
MNHHDEINDILEAAELSAEYRSMWMKSLPAQLGTLIRVALAARSMMHCITWHERNGGLSDDAPRLHEVREVFEETSLKVACMANYADLITFDQCVELIDDLRHGSECPICLNLSDLWMFRDQTVWSLISA